MKMSYKLQVTSYKCSGGVNLRPFQQRMENESVAAELTSVPPAPHIHGRDKGVIRLLILFLFLFLTTLLHPRETMTDIYQRIADNIPDNKVLTISEFKGNYANEFTREMLSFIIERKNISFVDYNIHRLVLEESLRYAEPVFDDKYNDTMPNLISPDIAIFGSANIQKSNFIFKQREHFDYEVNIVELSTGLILANLNDRIQVKYNPPIILIIVLITLIILVARWVIYKQNGYHILVIVSVAMGLITLILVWFIL